jgi:hypothetical protein
MIPTIKSNIPRVALGLILCVALGLAPSSADACEACSDSLRCQPAQIGSVGSLDCNSYVTYRNGELLSRECNDYDPPYCGGEGGYWCMFFLGVC